MKVFPSTCLFELVKVNENTSTQYKIHPFPNRDILSTKKEYLSQTWIRGYFEYLFLPFRTQETIYKNEPLDFSLSPLFKTL